MFEISHLVHHRNMNLTWTGTASLFFCFAFGLRFRVFSFLVALFYVFFVIFVVGLDSRDWDFNFFHFVSSFFSVL